jgi:hypothetical protein
MADGSFSMVLTTCQVIRKKFTLLTKSKQKRKEREMLQTKSEKLFKLSILKQIKEKAICRLLSNLRAPLKN